MALRQISVGEFGADGLRRNLEAIGHCYKGVLRRVARRRVLLDLWPQERAGCVLLDDPLRGALCLLSRSGLIGSARHSVLDPSAKSKVIIACVKRS